MKLVLALAAVAAAAALLMRRSQRGAEVWHTADAPS